MATDANTGQPIFGGHTSWGRTRSPKNIAGPQGSSSQVTVVAESTLDAVTDGYATENQRFLHVLVADRNDGTNLTVTVYGYNHAFGMWAPLNTLGVSGTIAGTAAVVTVANSSTAMGSQTATHRELVTLEIAGTDRVAFVGDVDDVMCWAACSTF